MKRLLATSIALATLASGAQANVNLPGGIVDGWETDGSLYTGAALQQGYLTLSGTQNHFVNPAYSLDLQNSAQANMFNFGAFSGGVWTPIFGQDMGVYLGRPTGADSALYNNADYAPTSLFDVYWADSMGFGDLGIRLNIRARSESEEDDVQGDDEISESGGLYEVNLTTGAVLDDMPAEVTTHLGFRFGSITDLDESNDEQTVSGVDSGLRWGATGKYTLNESDQTTNLISAYVGGAGGSYDSVTEDLDADETTADMANIYTIWTAGVVASHERALSSNARLIASAALRRTATKSGTENRQPDDTVENYTQTTTYNLPVSVGLEVDSSDRTTLSGSISSSLYNRNSETTYSWNPAETEAEETSNESTNWGFNAAGVRLGIDRELAEGLHGRFVLNQGILNNNGLGGALASHAQLNYEF